jgi:hypothetical protein
VEQATRSISVTEEPEEEEPEENLKKQARRITE